MTIERALRAYPPCQKCSRRTGQRRRCFCCRRMVCLTCRNSEGSRKTIDPARCDVGGRPKRSKP